MKIKTDVDLLADNMMRLRSDHHYQIEEFGLYFTVPVGFITDGASIPRILWPIIGSPKSSEYLGAAIAHDWLCVRANIEQSYEARVIADAVFFYLLKRMGVRRRKRAAMYLAVRWWGRYTYNPGMKADVAPPVHREEDG